MLSKEMNGLTRYQYLYSENALEKFAGNAANAQSTERLLVLPDIIQSSITGASRAHIARPRYVLKVSTPAYALRFEEINDCRDILWYANEVIVIETKIIAAD